jgi:hypothetical protein
MYLFNDEAREYDLLLFLLVEREIWRLPAPTGSRLIYAPYLSRVAPGTGMSLPESYRFLFNHHHGKGIFYYRKQRGFPKGHAKLSYALVTG